MTKLLLVAGAALLISVPAFAAEHQISENRAEAPAQAVSVRGVDFANREQVRQFYSRLNVAARAVCDAGGSARASAVDAQCVRQVVADAVKVADKPMLTALYNTTGDANHAFAGNDQ